MSTGFRVFNVKFQTYNLFHPKLPTYTPHGYEDTCHVDAAWKRETGTCGVGGIFRGPNCTSLPTIRYHRRYTSSALIAEALAVRSAVMMAASSNIQSLTVFSDSSVLISLLKTKESRPALYGIMFDIYHLCRLFDTISFCYVPRLQNTEADEVAKSALLCADVPPME
ncbi:hypothetical protein IGI04_022093 [Brassica rapa subsp. trilocularis]|uniref:RNase H type-1 domain-containing protein n=1 Tax=Brassica rapa subsp. trilocularis TaxID=1813537 RepID=A0ABQ7LZZ9_BRACM|nr:hypothetical protein IGI04_022093 [Brassica rapa subsp. trilocularis]